MLLGPCRCVRPAAISAQRALVRLFSSRSVVDVLESRGMVHAMTSRALKEHLSTTDDLGHHVSRTIYTGVDPSAASLHVGNLLPLVALLHCAMHGHKALVLVRKHELTPRSVALREPLAIHQDASQNALHWHQIN